MSIRNFTAGRATDLSLEAQTLANGAILVDEYDTIVFDRVLRRYPLWNRIDKRLAPGETTGGFEQTGVQQARAADPRSLGFSATGPTRQARTRRNIRAITADLEFGIFDRSVYQQQGRRFGDIEAKDVQDMVNSCLRFWSQRAYVGDEAGSGNVEFDGLRVLLGPGDDVTASESVVKAITDTITDMMNTEDYDVLPTAIYTNARVVQFIQLELFSVGDRLPYAPIMIGNSVFQVAQLATPAGFLPLIADPFNGPILGTPNVYPTFIVTEEAISWQYVEILGIPGPEPKTLEISLTNTAAQQYKTLMFGALELLGGTVHHRRLNIEHRDTPVEPTA